MNKTTKKFFRYVTILIVIVVLVVFTNNILYKHDKHALEDAVMMLVYLWGITEIFRHLKKLFLKK